jgi:excisionase family DNA binding protein
MPQNTSSDNKNEQRDTAKTPANPSGLLTLRQVSREFGIGYDRLRRAIARGELSASRPGDRWFAVSRSDILAFLAKRTAEDGHGAEQKERATAD